VLAFFKYTKNSEPSLKSRYLTANIDKKSIGLDANQSGLTKWLRKLNSQNKPFNGKKISFSQSSNKVEKLLSLESKINRILAYHLKEDG